MRRLARYLLLCTVLLLVGYGILSSNSVSPRAQDQDDPACRDICFQQFQACYFAAFPSRPETHKCLAAYRHCIAHCK